MVGGTVINNTKTAIRAGTDGTHTCSVGDAGVCTVGLLFVVVVVVVVQSGTCHNLTMCNSVHGAASMTCRDCSETQLTLVSVFDLNHSMKSRL